MNIIVPIVFMTLNIGKMTKHNTSLQSMSAELGVSYAWNKMVRQYEIVFVVGPYKTASSLVTSYFEVLGYSSPYQYDNPYEAGFGQFDTRYKTRESKTVRNLNIQILRDTGCGLNGSTDISRIKCKPATAFDIVSYLRLFPRRQVIKDPLFSWTLPIWINASRIADRKCFVIFTQRAHDLKAAWNIAPFTHELLKSNPSIIETMITSSEVAAEYARLVGVPYAYSLYDRNDSDKLIHIYDSSHNQKIVEIVNKSTLFV